MGDFCANKDPATLAKAPPTRYLLGMVDVLIADPGEIGRLVGSLLTQDGLSVQVARTGERALEFVAEAAPRVAVVDLGLRDISGLDLAELLIEEFDTVVLATGDDGATTFEQPDQARLARLSGHLRKPFKAADLRNAVRRACGLAALERTAVVATHGIHEDSSAPPVEMVVELEDLPDGAPDHSDGPSAPSAADDAEDAALAAWGAEDPDDPADNSAHEDTLEAVQESPADPARDTTAPADVGAPLPAPTQPAPAQSAPTQTAPAQPAAPLATPAPQVRGPAAPGAGPLGDPSGTHATHTDVRRLWASVLARPTPPRAEQAALAPTGPLTTGRLAALLDAVHQGRLTGQLLLARDSARRLVLFEDGHVVGALSNLRQEQTAFVAVRTGAVSPDTAKTLLVQSAGKPGRFLEAAVQTGALPPARATALASELTRQIVLGAFAWQSGQFRVDLGQLRQRPAFESRLSIADAILRGLLVHTAADALAQMATDDMRFAPMGDGAYGLHDVTLTGPEAHLVIGMDGTKTIGDLLTLHADLPERLVRGLAAGLNHLGIVRIVGRGSSEPRHISFF